MKRKHKMLILSLTSALVVAGVVAAGSVSAHDSAVGTQLIDKLASRFNLNKADVQKVFDETKAERVAEMEKNYEERLQTAVTNGSLTSTERDKILAKHKELEEFRQSLESKTVAEARDAMTAKHTELKKWADDNDIPLHYVMFGVKKGHGPGKFGPGFEAKFER